MGWNYFSLRTVSWNQSRSNIRSWGCLPVTLGCLWHILVIQKRSPASMCRVSEIQNKSEGARLWWRQWPPCNFGKYVTTYSISDLLCLILLLAVVVKTSFLAHWALPDMSKNSMKHHKIIIIQAQNIHCLYRKFTDF